MLAKTKGQLPAPLAALDAIAKGCNLPLEEGLKVETDRFVPLVGSTISRNLIAIFFMTQSAAKDPGVADAERQAARRAAGRRGRRRHHGRGHRRLPTCAAASRSCSPMSPPMRSQKGIAAITKVMQGRIEIGRMTPAGHGARRAGAAQHARVDLRLLADSDVVIEAVVENEEVKTTLFRDLQEVLPAGAILASNTSTISITRMAQAVAQARRTSRACTSSIRSIACSSSR